MMQRTCSKGDGKAQHLDIASWQREGRPDPAREAWGKLRIGRRLASVEARTSERARAARRIFRVYLNHSHGDAHLASRRLETGSLLPSRMPGLKAGCS